MSTLQERERVFENKFAHDQERVFMANARRNKLFGLWAAEKLGLDAEAATLYAQQAVLTDFENHGQHNQLLNTVYADFVKNDTSLTPAALQKVYDELLDEAHFQLDGEV